MVSSDVVFLGFASPRSPSNVSLLVGRRDGGGGGGRAQSENLEKYLFRKVPSIGVIDMAVSILYLPWKFRRTYPQDNFS